MVKVPWAQKLPTTFYDLSATSALETFWQTLSPYLGVAGLSDCAIPRAAGFWRAS